MNLHKRIKQKTNLKYKGKCKLFWQMLHLSSMCEMHFILNTCPVASHPWAVFPDRQSRG